MPRLLVLLTLCLVVGTPLAAVPAAAAPVGGGGPTAQPSVASAKVTAADRKRWKAPQGPFFNDPRRKEGLVPHRAEGHRHDQAHAPGLDDPDRGLLVRPDAGREGAHRRAPSWREGADDPQRPPVHQGDASDPQGDRSEALPLELHLPVHGRVPEQAEPVQQHAHEVLLVLPGRQVQGRPRRGVGQHDAQRRHPPVERPLLHLRATTSCSASSSGCSTTCARTTPPASLRSSSAARPPTVSRATTRSTSTRSGPGPSRRDRRTTSSSTCSARSSA